MIGQLFENRPENLRRRFDWLLFLPILTLLLIGVINLFSATATTTTPFLKHQIIRIGISLLAFSMAAIVDYRSIRQFSYWVYAFGILLLIILMFIGSSINESRRWLFSGSFGAQPSEIIKVCMIAAVAKYLHDDQKPGGRGLRDMIFPLLLAAIPALLILLQPDLGTAVLLMLVFMSMMLLTRLKLQTYLVTILLGLVALPYTWFCVLKPYQKQRVLTFLNPADDPSGAGWQSRQALYAIGSGKWLGRGYRFGTQNQLKFLPERRTDFPFAVWAEEWGFIGSALVIGLYFIIIWRALNLAATARDRFGAILSVGVASLIFWHVIINIGMVSGLAPVVGVTLPYISYGGSSMVTIMIASGLLMNVSIRRNSF